MGRVIFSGAVLVLCLCSGWSVGQDLKPRPAAENQDDSLSRSSRRTSAEDAEGAVVVPMSVAAGTPIKVALDSEVRVREVGQAIHGKTTEPVYAFDKLLIPVGTVVNGKVSAIDAVPKRVRTLDAADGNFSPRRNVHVQFDELVMGDGRHVALQTVASPAPERDAAGDPAAVERIAEADSRAGKDAQAETNRSGAASGASAIY